MYKNKTCICFNIIWQVFITHLLQLHYTLTRNHCFCICSVMIIIYWWKCSNKLDIRTFSSFYIAQLFNILVLIGMVFLIIWDGLWKDIFQLGTAAAAEFCEWLLAGIDVYISYCKKQLEPHWFPWFSAGCTAFIAHSNCFFHLYQQNKSSLSKGRFSQASNSCKRVIEAARFAYINKTKRSITSQKYGSLDFWRLADDFLTEKSAKPPLFNGPNVLSSALDKVKLFAENFSKNSNLDDSGISLSYFSSRTNLELQDIPAAPTLVEKVTTNLDSSKASGLVCSTFVVLKNSESELS